MSKWRGYRRCTSGGDPAKLDLSNTRSPQPDLLIHFTVRQTVVSFNLPSITMKAFCMISSSVQTCWSPTKKQYVSPPPSLSMDYSTILPSPFTPSASMPEPLAMVTKEQSNIAKVALIRSGGTVPLYAVLPYVFGLEAATSESVVSVRGRCKRICQIRARGRHSRINSSPRLTRSSKL